MKEFKSVHIDLEKGIYELSGVDISKEPISKFAIWFDNGTWSVSYDIAVTFESKKDDLSKQILEELKAINKKLDAVTPSPNISKIALMLEGKRIK